MLLKTTRTAVLTVAALDILAEQQEGCCPHCCGMCGVLEDMKKTDDLTDIVLKAPPYMYLDAVWWDAKKARVDLIWLTYQWASYTCPNHVLPDEDERTDTEREADEQAALARVPE
jgi:hypothetical protein